MIQNLAQEERGRGLIGKIFGKCLKCLAKNSGSTVTKPRKGGRLLNGQACKKNSHFKGRGAARLSVLRSYVRNKTSATPTGLAPRGSDRRIARLQKNPQVHPLPLGFPIP